MQKALVLYDLGLFRDIILVLVINVYKNVGSTRSPIVVKINQNSQINAM